MYNFVSKKFKFGLRGKTTLVLTGLLVLAMTIIIVVGFWQSQTVAREKVMQLELSKFSLLKHEIEVELLAHHNNLMSLHDVVPVSGLIRARNHKGIDPESGNSLDEWRKRLTTIFDAILTNHPQYFQVRFIDASGDELVKVEKVINGIEPYITQPVMQNKSDSLYVSETLKLKSGQAYFSDVSLNREHGVIQVPHVPVLRIATPVYDASNTVAGLIVINLLTERLLSEVGEESNGIVRNIVDEKGQYIKHVDASKTFGMERGFDYRFQKIEPELSSMLSSHDFYITHNENEKELNGFQKVFFSPQDHSRYWLMTLHVPEEIVFSDIALNLKKMLAISVVVGLFSLLLILWYVSGKILTPVVRLAAAVKALKAGDLTVRVDTRLVRDEFYTLSMAFNAFAENQQKSTQQLEHKVDMQTKRLSAVIDNVVDGIITISERGMIETFNTAASKIFGYSEEEVIGKNVKMLMPEPYHSEHDGYLEHFHSTGEKKVIGIGREVAGRRKDGTVFPMELAVSQIDIDNDMRFVGITRDISERKRVEQMQKEFISTVSHELRTPLTSIRGSLGLILGGVAGELPEKIKSLLTIANNNSERLIDLINDILDIEKLASGKMQFDYSVVNLTQIVTRALESNKGYADQLQVQLKLMTDTADEFLVRVDEKRLDQVMSNLLSNAAKYSPTNDFIEVSIELKNKKVRVSVHDHGKGIPEEFKSRIFSKFAQADSSDTRQKGGTGLGLNITKAIIEQHDGSIGFESSEETGTTFYIDLPIWVEEHIEKATINTASDLPLVLVVEDDRDISRLLCIMLEKEKYRCHQAFSYSEAVQHIQNHQYDAVTLDLTIPGGSGVTLLRELRKNEETKDLPVVVVSATANEGQLEVEGEAFSMVDWIEKPIDENRLLESIHAGITRTDGKESCILHVEDDKDIAMIVSSMLGTEYQIVHATTLSQAKQMISEGSFDLVLLDIGLPDGSGLDLIPMLNSMDNPVPVIIFSAQEVSLDISKQVQGALLKSKTDNDKLMQHIKSVISKK